MVDRAEYDALRKKIYVECEDSPEYHKWKQGLKPNSHRGYRAVLWRFVNHIRQGGGPFAYYTLTELTQFQRNAEKDDRYLLLDIVQDYCRNLKVITRHGERLGETRAGTKKTAYAVLCSFFVHNRAPFPPDKFSLTSNIPKVRKLLTLTELKSVVLSSNTTYAAIFLCMLLSGMGVGELVRWSTIGLEDLLDQRVQKKTVYSQYHPFGRKKNDAPFYSRIGGDAIIYLHRYLDKVRPKIVKRTGTKSDAIFLTSHGNPITKNAVSQYWRNHLESLGLILIEKPHSPSKRHNKGGHQIRSLTRTQWSESPAKDVICEGLMGHIIDKNDYNQIMNKHDWVTREYRKALPWLNIMTSNTPFGLYTEDEVEERSEDYKTLRAEMDELLEEKRKRDL